MKREYLFDVKLFAAVRIKAESEEQARFFLSKMFDTATCTVCANDSYNQEPLEFEASLDTPDGSAEDLVEIDDTGV